MMKIGILTFWGVPNYGAFAQAYALNKVMSLLFPNDSVEHIGYLHPVHYTLYNGSRKIFSNLKDFFVLQNYKKLIRRILQMNVNSKSFTAAWNIIPHTKVHSEKILEKKYWDLIVLGSDAIWEYSIKDFGDDIHLIGNGLNCRRIISYAASFGNMKPDNSFYSFMINGLKRIDFITVRDNISAEIVDMLVNRKADVVLDPSLLWDFSTDKNIPESKYTNYILVYGADFSASIKHQVTDYAYKHDLKIIGAGLFPDWCDINLFEVSPFEWISLFKKAEFVLTCTFHGLMFSIQNRRKVYFHQVEYVKNRSQTLLNITGIDKIMQNKNLCDVLNDDWDYDKIMEKLDTQRKFSFDILVSMVKKCNE